MTRSLRTALAATVIAATVCAVVVRGQLWIPSSAAAAEAIGADSLTAADSAVRLCAHETADKIPCYEKVLLPLVDAGGPVLAMGTLGRIAAADHDVQAFGHVYAHAIGIHAFDVDRDVGRTFSSCRDAFQSGCYHGVIESYFTHSSKVDSTSVRELCVPWTKAGVYGWLRFQCVHGLGHGLTMWYAHDLVRALAGCDLLAESWDRESCYGGAFMENVVDATKPHHMMPMDGMPEMATHFKQMDAKDQNYPCTILSERYLTTCYQNQVSIIMHLNEYDMPRVAHGCMNVPEQYRYMCFTGFGTNINSYVVGDHRKALDLCAVAPTSYRQWCIIGVVKNIVDVSAKTADGVAFCREVEEPRLKGRCYEAVGEESVSLEPAAAVRETFCAVSEPDYVEACRFGARLISVRPAGLTAG
jgi:hypothetical protein